MAEPATPPRRSPRCRIRDQSRRRTAKAPPPRRPSVASMNVPGHGALARTCRLSSAAGRSGSSRASSRRNGRVIVAAPSSWATAGSPRATPERPAQQLGTPCAAAPRAGAPLVPESGHASWATIGPGVEAVVHAHDRDARRGVAGEDRGRDRRRAPVAGQQRRMQVEGPVRGGRAGPADDLAVVGEDPEARSERGIVGDRRPARADAAGSASGSSPPRGRGDRGRRGACAPTGPVGRGDDARRAPRSWSPRQRSRMGTANAPLPRKTVRRSRAGRDPARRSREGARRLADPRRRPRRRRRARRRSARPSSRGSRCTACRRGGRARAGARGRAAPIPRP